MKFLFLIAITILSLNAFSAELGEDQKSPCPFLNQTSKREAKTVVSDNTSSSKAPSTASVIGK